VTSRTHAAIFGALLILAVGSVSVPAQDARISAPALAPTPPGAYHLSLEEAEQRALAQNKNLTLGRLGVQEKSIATSAARTDYFPKVLGNVTYFHFNDNLGSVVTVPLRRLGPITLGGKTVAVNAVNQDSTLGSFTVAQPITKLILVNAAVKLASADAAIAKAQLDKGTRELLTDVAEGFYGLQGARQIDAALSLQVEYLQQALRAAPKPETRVTLIETQQALLQAHSQAADLNEQLGNLLSFPAGTILMPTEPLPPTPSVHSPDEAAQVALACNPQVLEAKASLDKARAGLQAANAEFLPDINVFGSYFNQSMIPSIQQNIGAIGVTGSYTFVDFGKRRKVKFQRQTQIIQAQVNVQATIDKVVLEARQAYLGYEQSQQALTLASEMVQARKESESDLKDPAAIQTAKGATAKAGLEQIQAAIAYRVACARLAGAMGRQ
jgi:outer membrane protein TolC